MADKAGILSAPQVVAPPSAIRRSKRSRVVIYPAGCAATSITFRDNSYAPLWGAHQSRTLRVRILYKRGIRTARGERSSLAKFADIDQPRNLFTDDRRKVISSDVSPKRQSCDTGMMQIRDLIKFQGLCDRGYHPLTYPDRYLSLSPYLL